MNGDVAKDVTLLQDRTKVIAVMQCGISKSGQLA